MRAILNQRNLSQIATFGLIAVSLLFVLCSSMILHTFHASSAAHHMSSEQSSTASDSGTLEVNHMVSILNLSVAGGVFLSLLAIATAFLLLSITSSLFSQKSLSYIYSIKDKYGGFRILNHLQNLFSKGILNSQIFSYSS